MLNDLLRVLLSDLLVFVVTLDGLLNLGDFVLRQVATLILAVFPGVEVVVGALRALADDGEGAVLHAWNLEDLFEEGFRREGCIHETSIEVHLYYTTKNSPN